MKNPENGFSPEERTRDLHRRQVSARDEETLRQEFEIMQRLDFVFIKELGARTAEEYILKVSRLKYSPAKHLARKRVR
jgi:hypothetical protein